MKTRKFASEIYWPLAKRTHTHSRKYHDLHFARKHVLKISSTIWIYVPRLCFLKTYQAKWIWNRSMHSLFSKIWQLIVHQFLCFYPFLSVFAWCEPKIVLTILGSQQLKTQKKQSGVKFWFNWRKRGAVSYSLSCKYK